MLFVENKARALHSDSSEGSINAVLEVVFSQYSRLQFPGFLLLRPTDQYNYDLLTNTDARCKE